jgi:arylformamidase
MQATGGQYGYLTTFNEVNRMKIYDISIPIHEQMTVYPGNPKPKISQYSTIPANVTNESLICLGSHTGSHVDSKRHIQNNTEGAAALPLDSLYGKAKVFDLTNVENEIHEKDFEKYKVEKDDIILLKTKNSQKYKQFTTEFVHLKMDAAQYLVNSGVKTLGFDYLSVKKYGADDDVHSLLINNLTLFEGLNLLGVPGGEYIFAGLPLRIDCDGAPARVILITPS